MNYDVIGDLHGEADALVELLRALGYRESGGAWRLSGHTAIFLGDFIDRGPKQLETLDLVRKMVDTGSALSVIGNHEFNAVAWFLPDPRHPGAYLRTHDGEKGTRNQEQHAAFLSAVAERPGLHEELVEWFLSLPLWLDLPDLRIVHACWHPRFMDFLKPSLRDGNLLSKELMVPASEKPPRDERDSPEPSAFKAVEAITKGLEVQLPAGVSYLDKSNHERHRARVAWWDAEATSYRSAALRLTDAQRRQLTDDPIPEHLRLVYGDSKPLFFGHYGLADAHPAPVASRVACVDYSTAHGGLLCAYSYEGEPCLAADRFTRVALPNRKKA
jgi:hypothetical protein